MKPKTVRPTGTVDWRGGPKMTTMYKASMPREGRPSILSVKIIGTEWGRLQVQDASAQKGFFLEARSGWSHIYCDTFAEAKARVLEVLAYRQNKAFGAAESAKALYDEVSGWEE